jgi:hypothetical protein
MAYVFISDDGPDAEEFQSNYIAFDPSNERIFAEIRHILATEDCRAEAVRNRLEHVCQSSLKPDGVNDKRHFFDPILQIKRFASLLFDHHLNCGVPNTLRSHQW